MTLDVRQFKLHASLKKTLTKFANAPNCEIRVDSAFEQVIHACASSVRNGHARTWIVPSMIQAYLDLHHAGLAHSVETWIDERLVGGLYCVGIGHAVFGESMFHRVTDGSKIALAALVSLCRHSNIFQIDCQQNTKHLLTLGAKEISRQEFIQKMLYASQQPNPEWRFWPQLWSELFAIVPRSSVAHLDMAQTNAYLNKSTRR